MNKMSKTWLLALATVTFALVGCGGGAEDTAAGTTTPTPATGVANTTPRVDFEPNADAGVAFKMADPTKLIGLLASNGGRSARRDPFGLLPVEAAFEQSQRAAKFTEDAGGFTFDYEAPPEKDDTPVLEPQPYRRCAGILVGESGISALIDMGDGQFQNVRPGQKIGEWTVVAIDEEGATIRRPGNKLPREVRVPLEQPAPGQGGGNDGGGANPGGTAGGRNPGGGNPRGNRGGGGAAGSDL